MNKKKLLILVMCVVLSFVMLLPMFSSCAKPEEKPEDTKGQEEQKKTEDRVTNDTYTLILQTSTFDGVFSPFFGSNAYDTDVTNLVNVGLLTLDPTGSVVAGNNYDTVAKGYEIYYTNDLTNYTKKDSYSEGDYVVYSMVIKNGAKFSDGQPITADDVLFNYYVLLDPAYDGSQTLYTLPVLGLTDYRTQVPSSATYQAVANAIFANGSTYKESSAYTKEQFDAYWAAMDVAGKAFAEEIAAYCKAKYGTNKDYIGTDSKYCGDAKKFDISKPGFYYAFGMAMWGFGSFDAVKVYKADAAGTYGKVGEAYKTLYTKTTVADDAKFADAAGAMYTKAVAATATADCVYITGANADGTYNVAAITGDRYVIESTTYPGSFTDAAGNKYDMVTTFPTVDDYWKTIKNSYSDDKGVVDYTSINSVESAGMDLIAKALEGFLAGYTQFGSVKNIAGLVKGETTIDGTKYETVKVILTEQNPKAILSLGVSVAPKHYYTAGYNYPTDAVVNYGVENGLKSNAFMSHLKTFNANPVGAGVYKFTGLKDGDAYFERNTYHETMGDSSVYNANIKNLCMKVVTSGAEFNALTAGDVAYATVSATSDVMKDIANNAKVDSILVDNLGYGYICINPSATEYGLDNLYTRIALTTVFNLSVISNYYPSGLADVIYRSMSQVSWAYPEGAKAIYDYDATGAKAIEYFKKAGYTFDETTKKFTDTPTFDFYLPSDAKDHPAGDIFVDAQKLLATIGVASNIKTDENLIANIKKDHVPVYALAWQATPDPDMYQVYHYASSAESVFSNGITFMYENLTKEDKGTIEVTKLDGTKATMTQSQAVKYLGDLIEQGTKYMNKEERKPIYEKALEVVAQLNFELPTYQRKNLFAYDETVIDGKTLSETVTPYWGPMAEIWKVSFADGVSGNTKVTVNLD